MSITNSLRTVIVLNIYYTRYLIIRPTKHMYSPLMLSLHAVMITLVLFPQGHGCEYNLKFM